jgi:preprotein translocase subunit SecB
LTYGGVFQLLNIPQDSLQPLLLVECPRLLFPFARRIVADATRDGGFPPLMIDPIDFVALYRQRQQQAQAAAQQAAAATGDQGQPASAPN